MPVSRHSCVLRSAYSGNRGKQLLVQALEFLFFIKTNEFRKFHPTFITPSPEEFLEYAKYVHDTYPRVGRRVRVLRHEHTKKTLFVQYLSYILPGITNKMLRNYAIVVYALTSFLTFRDVIDAHLAPTATSIDVDIAGFCEPISWFVNSITPSKSMPERILQYIEHAIIPKTRDLQLQTKSVRLFEALGCDVVNGISSIMLDDAMYHNVYFVIPISYALASQGFDHMKNICATTIEKHKENFV